MATDIILGDYRIDAQGDVVISGGSGGDGDLYVHDKDGNETIHLGGNDARIELGKHGNNDGDIFIFDKDGNETIHLGGNDARLRLGKTGNNDGDIFIHNKEGNETIHLGGNHAVLELGGDGEESAGDLIIRDTSGNPKVHVSAQRGYISDDTPVAITGSGEIRAAILELTYAAAGGGGTLTPASEGFSLSSRLDIMKSLQVGGVAGFGGGNSGAGNVFIANTDGRLGVNIDGEEGSIHFGDSPNPLLYILEAGHDHPNRPIIADSPDHPNWGLLYQSGAARMIFQQEDSPVLTADLGQQNVGIGIDTPDTNVKLDVKGKIRTTASVDTSSDARCKENVEPIVNATETIARLRGVSFRWKQDDCGDIEFAPGRHLGFIAQETHAVLPEVVSQDDHGYHSIAYSEIIPVLVEGFKEQQQTIADLRAENEAMQQALNDVQTRTECLETLEARLAHLEQMLAQQPT